MSINFDTASILNFSVSAWRAAIKLPPSVLTTIGDPIWFTGTKKLLPKSIISPPIQIANSARMHIRAFCTPFPIQGLNLISNSLIPRLNDILAEHKANFDNAVEHLAQIYHQAIQDAKEHLEPIGLFNQNDYPRNITQRYSFSWRYITIASQQSLSIMDPDFIAEEKAKFQQMIDEARILTKQALTEQLHQLIQHAVERLTPDNDGKQKIFRDTLVTNFDEYFDTFYHRNIWNDQELTDLVEKAKRVLRNVSPNQLRSSTNIRETIADGLKQLKDILDQSMSELPTRHIILDQEAA